MQWDAGKNNILHARNVRKTRTETTQQIAVPHGVPCISGKRQPPSDVYCNMTSGLWVPLALYFWSVKMANVIRVITLSVACQGSAMSIPRSAADPPSLGLSCKFSMPRFGWELSRWVLRETFKAVTAISSNKLSPNLTKTLNVLSNKMPKNMNETTKRAIFLNARLPGRHKSCWVATNLNTKYYKNWSDA